ncbi:Importin alpha subunit (Karyopherin alpha subunit) (Serine-rich RNA polymerase I suppressor protein) [Perkinsus chesapeaki]|uniref:Importin subunit alpha n=1 Tax=Perkinsus chesapeaki TaxID=330153 RepID=A0A7J6L9Y4_PERCH|nr:Importin alpha subunit (Karyopherin alpha subunit) (Serine-rich RNA polymerase I suppressor protein) [Perkinsus chesapeaki]
MSNIEDRIAARRKNYKKTGDFEDSRRRREDEAVQIRKAEKEKQLAHRRRMDVGSSDDAATTTTQSTTSAPNLAELQEAVVGCNSTDSDTQFRATQYVRRLLSIAKNPPIQYVIDAGLIPRMVVFLQDTQRPKLQFEAAWVLTNIASGTRAQTEAVVAAGTIPLFVALLASPDGEVREQAVWALGNIAGDSPRLRDMVLEANVLPGILNLFKDTEQVSLFRNATWALSNLCRGKPQPPILAIAPALPLLAQLINSNDVEVTTDACWALSYVTDGPSDRIQAVLDTGACPRLVELLKHSSTLVQTPALRAVGNIVTGDDNQTQQVVNCGGVEALHGLLYSPKKAIPLLLAQPAAIPISSESSEQIQECINKGLFGKLIELLANAEFDVKKEAAWAVSNATAGGSPEQVDYLVQNGCVKPLCDLLDVTDSKIVGCCLEAIDNILGVGVLAQERNPDLTENPYLHLIEEADGMTKIEDLQGDRNDAIYEKAVHILESYFPVEEDDDEGLGDMDSNHSGFATAGSAAPPAGSSSFGVDQQPAGGFHF